MPNYRDISFNNGQYIPQYAGVPLEEMRETGNVLATRHYENLAKMSQLRILQSQLREQALEGAKPYFDQHIQGVENALKDMAANGAENSTARVNALATAFQSDKGMLNAMQRSEEVKKLNALIQETTNKTGREAVYDKARLEAMRNASVYTTDANGNQVINPLYNSQFNLPVSPYLDPTIDYKRIVDEIKPDQWLSQKLSPNDMIYFKNKLMKMGQGQLPEDEIPKFVEWAQKKGITEDKIKGLKDEMFNAFKKTASYQQQKDYFGGTDQSQANDIYNYAKLGVYDELFKHYQQVTPGRTGEGKGTGTFPLAGDLLDPAVEGARSRGKMPWDLSLVTNFRRGEGIDAEQYQKERGFEHKFDPKEEQAAEVRHKNLFYDLVEATDINPVAGPDAPMPTNEQMEAFRKSPEGIEWFKNTLAEIDREELSNAYTQPEADPKMLNMADNVLKRNITSFNLFTPDGKQIWTANNKSERPDELKNIKDIEYGNTLGVYNLRSSQIGEDAAATGIHKITVTNNDGDVVDLYATNPGAINDPDYRAKMNANIIYNKLYSNMGSWTDIGNGTKAKYLYGNQKEKAWERHKAKFIENAKGDEELAREQFDMMQASGPLIEYSVPGGVRLGTPLSMAESYLPKSTKLSYKTKK